jgi:predicted amidohydrolase
VVLPEIWNSAYETSEFPKNAEDIDAGKSGCADFMSQAAKEHAITLVGGSIPESSGGNVYNTCLVYDKAGRLLAKHRKVGLPPRSSEGTSGNHQGPMVLSMLQLSAVMLPELPPGTALICSEQASISLI